MLKTFLNDAREDHYISSNFPDDKGKVNKLPFWLFIFLFIWWNIEGWFMAKYCEYFDHKWVGDGYGGPDSGYDAAHCERCGFSFHHTYY